MGRCLFLVNPLMLPWKEPGVHADICFAGRFSCLVFHHIVLFYSGSLCRRAGPYVTRPRVQQEGKGHRIMGAGSCFAVGQRLVPVPLISAPLVQGTRSVALWRLNVVQQDRSPLTVRVDSPAAASLSIGFSLLQESFTPARD